MRRFLFLLFVLFFAGLINAQNRNSEIFTEQVSFNQLPTSGFKLVSVTNFNRISGIPQNNRYSSELVFSARKINLKNPTPFLSFSCGWNEPADDTNNTSIRFRFSVNGKDWDKWITIKKDGHYEKGRYSFVSELMELKKEYRYYQIGIRTNLNKQGKTIQLLFLNFFSPGEKPATIAAKKEANSLPGYRPDGVHACSCARPDYTTRTGWNCPQTAWSTSTTSVTHLIVHHSAGSNTSSDWGATVLSIWNYHTGTNGWSDIGYNWLIAPDGTIFEGRYKSSIENTTGAHFCGTNGGTMGVCMLGTYMTQTITPAARNSLVRLLSWKSCERSIDPLAILYHASSNLTINTISGHRVGCTTECPGDMLFADLPEIRTDVKNYCDNGCVLTAIAETDLPEDFSVTPNPTPGSFYLKVKLNTSKNISYRIYDVNGKQLYSSPSEKWTGSITREITQLNAMPPGVYFIKLWVEGRQIHTQKIIRL